MRKIKRFIIHALGGVTESELLMREMIAAQCWELRRVRIIKDYLELMNGAPADDWCRQAYAYIERIERELCEENPAAAGAVDALGLYPRATEGGE